MVEAATGKCGIFKCRRGFAGSAGAGPTRESANRQHLPRRTAPSSPGPGGRSPLAPPPRVGQMHRAVGHAPPAPAPRPSAPGPCAPPPLPASAATSVPAPAWGSLVARDPVPSSVVRPPESSPAGTGWNGQGRPGREASPGEGRGLGQGRGMCVWALPRQVISLRPSSRRGRVLGSLWGRAEQ